MQSNSYFLFCLIWESQVTSCMNSIIRSPEGPVRSPWKQVDRVTKDIHFPWWYPSKNMRTMLSCYHESANSNMYVVLVVMSQLKSVSIVTRLWTGELRKLAWSLAVARYFSPLWNCPEQLWNPLSCLLLSGFLGVPWAKMAGEQSWSLNSNFIEGTNEWRYTSAPPCTIIWQTFRQLYLYVNGCNKNVAYNFWSIYLNSKLCCVLSVCDLFFTLTWWFAANNSQN